MTQQNFIDYFIVVSAFISLKPQWRPCQYRFPLLVSLTRNYNFRGLQLSRLSRLGIIYSILVNCVYDFALILCEEKRTNQSCIVKTETKLIIPENDQVKITSKGANRSLQVSNISSSNFVLFR